MSGDSIAGVIRDQPLLLVLDNCEHVVDASANLVHALLQRCESLRVLATSREALGVTGERAWLVPPLDLPDPAASVAALAQSDAVQLFIDRARDVVPDFALTTSNASDVGAICTRLDGIPLAVELAAARVRHMTPRQIHERLDDAFALLTSSARTAIPRHRTLRAAIEWSHDLLPEAGRVVLRRLSVFRGGFTLDMVEDVVAGDGIETCDVLDLVTRLADRSMLFVRERDGDARYQMLETMRQYASQKLDDAGEAERVRARLADAVSALVAEVEPSSRRLHGAPRLHGWNRSWTTSARCCAMRWRCIGVRSWPESRQAPGGTRCRTGCAGCAAISASAWPAHWRARAVRRRRCGNTSG